MPLMRCASVRVRLNNFYKFVFQFNVSALTNARFLCYTRCVAKLKTDVSGKGSNIRVEREYAKSIGVKSPTVLTKAQLDEAVRLRELELGITKERHTVYDCSPEERASLYSQISVKPRIQMFTGFFRPFPEGDGVLRRDPFEPLPEADVYVARELADEFRMMPGDRIVGNVSVLYYNSVRVLKNVRYINDEPATARPAVRQRFDDMPAMEPSASVRIGGNGAVAGILQDMIRLKEGQSLAITGAGGDVGYFERMAVDLIKGLYMSFRGDVYGIFEGVSEDCERALRPFRNPESTIVNGSRGEYPFLLEMMKRSAERKVPAVAVIYAPKCDVGDFLRASKAMSHTSLTVIAFTEDAKDADAVLPFEGERISVSGIKVVPTGDAGSRRLDMRAAELIGRMEDGLPDSVLSAFTELIHE